MALPIQGLSAMAGQFYDILSNAAHNAVPMTMTQLAPQNLFLHEAPSDLSTQLITARVSGREFHAYRQRAQDMLEKDPLKGPFFEMGSVSLNDGDIVSPKDPADKMFHGAIIFVNPYTANALNIKMGSDVKDDIIEAMSIMAAVAATVPIPSDAKPDQAYGDNYIEAADMLRRAAVIFRLSGWEGHALNAAEMSARFYKFTLNTRDRADRELLDGMDAKNSRRAIRVFKAHGMKKFAVAAARSLARAHVADIESRSGQTGAAAPVEKGPDKEAK